MLLTGERERERAAVPGQKPDTVSLCTPQISQGLAWDRTRASAVLDQHVGL